LAYPYLKQHHLPLENPLPKLQTNYKMSSSAITDIRFIENVFLSDKVETLIAWARADQNLRIERLLGDYTVLWTIRTDLLRSAETLHNNPDKIRSILDTDINRLFHILEQSTTNSFFKLEGTSVLNYTAPHQTRVYKKEETSLVDIDELGAIAFTNNKAAEVWTDEQVRRSNNKDVAWQRNIDLNPNKFEIFTLTPWQATATAATAREIAVQERNQQTPPTTEIPMLVSDRHVPVWPTTPQVRFTTPHPYKTRLGDTRRAVPSWARSTQTTPDQNYWCHSCGNTGHWCWSCASYICCHCHICCPGHLVADCPVLAQREEQQNNLLRQVRRIVEQMGN
jgi:hypothetical protein